MHLLCLSLSLSVLLPCHVSIMACVRCVSPGFLHPVHLQSRLRAAASDEHVHTRQPLTWTDRDNILRLKIPSPPAHLSLSPFGCLSWTQRHILLFPRIHLHFGLLVCERHFDVFTCVLALRSPTWTERLGGARNHASLADTTPSVLPHLSGPGPSILSRSIRSVLLPCLACVSCCRSRLFSVRLLCLMAVSVCVCAGVRKVRAISSLNALLLLSRLCTLRSLTRSPHAQETAHFSSLSLPVCLSVLCFRARR